MVVANQQFTCKTARDLKLAGHTVLERYALVVLYLMIQSFQKLQKIGLIRITCNTCRGLHVSCRPLHMSLKSAVLE